MSNLKDWDTKNLKRTYYRSNGIYAIAVLIIIIIAHSIIWRWITIKFMRDFIGVFANPLYLGLIILNIVALIGLIMRTTWGRIIGILTCGIWCLKFPIGTLIGIWGIVTLAPSSNLFGPKRILHKDLKNELKYRKK